MKYIKTGFLILFLMIPILIIIFKYQTVEINYNDCQEYYYNNKIINLTVLQQQQLNQTWITKDKTLLENLILVPGQKYQIVTGGIETLPNNIYYPIELTNQNYQVGETYKSDWYVNEQNGEYTKYDTNNVLGSLSTCKENND